MACESLLLVLVVAVQFSAICCGYYESNTEDENSFIRKLERFNSYLENNRFIAFLIGSAVDVILLGLLYMSVRCCCPSCGSRLKPGFVLTHHNIILPVVEPISAPPKFAGNNIELS